MDLEDALFTVNDFKIKIDFVDLVDPLLQLLNLQKMKQDIKFMCIAFYLADSKPILDSKHRDKVTFVELGIV